MSTNNAAHTPGPWIMECDPGSDHVAEIVGGNPKRTICILPWPGEDEEIEMILNARLVAAAPKLLEALRVLLPGLVLDLRYANDDDDKDAMRARIETVSEAIAMATERLT